MQKMQLQTLVQHLIQKLRIIQLYENCSESDSDVGIIHAQPS